MELQTACSRKESRVLGIAAALCLRDAVGGKAVILWPGDIVLGDETVARAVWQPGEGFIRIALDAPDAAAAETAETALRALAAGFPENGAEIIQSYCNVCRTLMKFVDVTYRGMPVYGFAFAVDKYGGLMVMTQASRSVVTVYGGPAELAKDEPQQPEMPIMPRV